MELHKELKKEVKEHRNKVRVAYFTYRAVVVKQEGDFAK